MPARGALRYNDFGHGDGSSDPDAVTPPWTIPEETMYELNTTYAQAEAERNVFVSKVYGWMGLGLLMTGITAWATASTPARKTSARTELL